MQTQRIPLNGIEFRLCSWGDPSHPKLILLHGFLDCGASFDRLARKLESKFHCVAPDLRGFGQTDHTKNPLGYHFFEYVADVHSLIEHLSPSNPVRLLGHSMGGNIVSLYAGTFPDRISHLVNLEGFGIRSRQPEEGPAQIRSWIEHTSKKSKKKPYSSLKEVASRLQVSNPHLDDEFALLIAEHMTVQEKNQFRFSFDHKHRWPNPNLFQIENVYPFWDQITAKSFLIYGDHSNMDRWMVDDPERFDEELQKRIEHFPKGTQVLELPGCGHMIHQEKPDEIAPRIEQFLLQ